jgi:hypothetical protein
MANNPNHFSTKDVCIDARMTVIADSLINLGRVMEEATGP